MKKHTPLRWMMLTCLSLVLVVLPATGVAAAKKLNVMCTTFPIYLITRNVTRGSDTMKIDLMLPSELGCPHDYALTPQDMRKLSKVDVLIVNGLGLEEFLGAPLEKANPHLTLVDSSSGIGDVIQYRHEEEHEPQPGGGNEHGHGAEAPHAQAHEHHHSGANPHLFASPRMAGLLAMNIAGALAKIDPSGAGAFFRNAQVYAEDMSRLMQDLIALERQLKNNRIVTQHGVFDYLARDMGLEVVAVVQPHAGQEPSAAEVLEIVAIIKAKKAGAIFTEPQYPAKIGQTIARETGIPMANLDPVATGPQDAPLDFYAMVMRKNLETLKKTLGIR